MVQKELRLVWQPAYHRITLVKSLTRVIAYMKNPDITTEEIMEYIPGPDFPTGGIVINKDELVSIYESGNGKIKLRGKVEIEPMKGGKERIWLSLRFHTP